METSLLPQTSLTKEQKEAVGLLSVGTFLEYFDLMLYVHMAVLLNELFFPKSDPFNTSLLSAFAFCSSYALRPVGALIFGWIGDNIGRKTTVILTTAMMALSCLAMSALPTYNQIGITASWIMILCRMAQGLSSMGEIVGAELYITEITKPPTQYLAVGLVTLCSVVGGTVAIVLSLVCISGFFNWRYAFLSGAFIAILGMTARAKLRETVEFVDAKKRMQNAINELDESQPTESEKILIEKIYNKKANIKTSLAYLYILSPWPAIFFFTYVHCGDILKNTFHYNAEQILKNNLYVSIFNAIFFGIIVLLTKKFHPLKILKTQAIIFLVVILSFPYLLSHASSALHIFWIQLLLMLITIRSNPAAPIFYKRFPVFWRFRYAAFLYAISRLLIYIITSFGTVYLIKAFGYYGILVIMLPIGLLFYHGIRHFEELDLYEKNF